MLDVRLIFGKFCCPKYEKIGSTRFLNVHTTFLVFATTEEGEVW